MAVTTEHQALERAAEILSERMGDAFLRVDPDTGALTDAERARLEAEISARLRAEMGQDGYHPPIIAIDRSAPSGTEDGRQQH